MIILTGLVLIFQNCSSGKNIPIDSSTEGSQAIKSTSSKAMALPLDLKTAIGLQINNVRNTVAMNPEDLLVKPDVYYYIINFADGKVQSYDYNDVNLNKSYCLTDSDREELTNILSTAQICKSVELSTSEQEGLVCTMEYVMPYARLFFPHGKAYTFGEKMNGCQIPTDLCEDYASLLRGFARNFLLQIKSKICD
jgi:hypothetical protein